VSTEQQSKLDYVSILPFGHSNNPLMDNFLSRVSTDTQAIGDGIKRQVLGDAIDSMLEDPSICTKLADDGGGIYGPAIRDLSVTTQGVALQVLGLLTMIHLRWLGLLPQQLNLCSILAIFSSALAV
jgi:hypothetical protein